MGLVALKDEVAADLHFQPFELNPQMGAEGQDITEHIAEKYGSTPTDIERNRENIRSKQEALKNALFAAYFTEGRNPSDHEVLLDVSRKVGLDPKRASEILKSNEFAAEVRQRDDFFTPIAASGRCLP